MTFQEKRDRGPDRRQISRGGRRPSDQAGLYPSVLVADNFDGVRNPCARYLSRYHFKVVEALDGAEALARIEADVPRIILTDSTLPEMPLGRLTEWLDRKWRGRQIPIIAMAGDLDFDSPQLFDGCVAGVLIKPFTLERMLHEVRRVLREDATRP